MQRGTLLWRQRGFELEWGRRSLSFGDDRLSELAWGRQVPAVDMLRYALETPGGAWRLDVGCAQLAARHDGELRRWAAFHRLSWRPRPGLRLYLGDQALYTGRQRGFELHYLSPFLPYLLENFEGYSERDAGEPTDADNSVLLVGWQAEGSLGRALGFEHYGELLVDELQIDGEDRRRFDDALGLTLGLALQRELPASRRLRLRVEGSWLSHWTYIHPGAETSWLEKGLPLGNREGGDLAETHLELQLLRLAAPIELVSVAMGWIRKGAITPQTEWDIEATKGSAWPLPPRRSDRSWRVAALRALRPDLLASLEAERRLLADDWTLRLRLSWTLPPVEDRR
jgi:hypothetical protein